MPKAKRIEWYYGDRGKIVGPLPFEDIAGRIIRAPNDEHLVWTQGMTRWSDAKTIPTFTDCFRANPPPSSGAVALFRRRNLDQARKPTIAARVARAERATTFAG